MATPSKTVIDASVRLACLGAFAAFLIASPLQAQSGGDRAVAESLFLEARKLMGENKIHEACAKFEASQKLDPAAGTLLNLAVCHEREGRVATAWSEFRESLALAKREQREDREKLSAERVEALEKRLPKLVIEVPAASKTKGLTVRVNGTPLVEAAWGTAVPVDPGESLVEAEAPGHKSWTSKVNVAESKTESVKIPPLQANPVAPASASSAAAPTAPPPQPVPPPDDSLRKGASYALLGVGAIGVGVGGYFGLRAFSKKSDSDSNCPQNHCSQAGVDLNNEAKSSARIANLGVGLGLVAIGAGVYLLFSGPPAPEQSTASLSFSVAPLPRGGAASLGGSF